MSTPGSTLNTSDLDAKIQALQNILAGQGGGSIYPNWAPGHAPHSSKAIGELNSMIQQFMAQKSQMSSANNADQMTNLAQQEQNTLLPKASALFDLQNALLSQEKDQAGKVIPFIQGLAGLQQGLVGDQRKLAQNALDLSNQDQNTRMTELNGLQPTISNYDAEANTAPGSLTPTAQAMYSQDLQNIQSSYDQGTQAGLKQLSLRGMGNAPSGAESSLVNSNMNARAGSQAEARRNAIMTSEGMRTAARDKVAGLRMGLAGMFDPLPSMQTGLAGENAAAGTAAQAGQTENSTMAPFNTEQNGLAGLGGALGANTNVFSNAGSMLGGAGNLNVGTANSSNSSTNDWMNFAQQFAKKSPLSSILGGIGSIGSLIAAPFTGGTSLAGLGGLFGSLFNKPQAPTLNSNTSSGVIGSMGGNGQAPTFAF